jgi:hypothetical protein
MSLIENKNLEKIVPGLHALFIFNQKFAGKKEEDDYLQILYFYPNNMDLGKKMKYVGLTRGLVQFTK